MRSATAATSSLMTPAENTPPASAVQGCASGSMNRLARASVAWGGIMTALESKNSANIYKLFQNNTLTQIDRIGRLRRLLRNATKATHHDASRLFFAVK